MCLKIGNDIFLISVRKMSGENTHWNTVKMIQRDFFNSSTLDYQASVGASVEWHLTQTSQSVFSTYLEAGFYVPVSFFDDDDFGAQKLGLNGSSEPAGTTSDHQNPLASTHLREINQCQVIVVMITLEVIVVMTHDLS